MHHCPKSLTAGSLRVRHAWVTPRLVQSGPRKAAIASAPTIRGGAVGFVFMANLRRHARESVRVVVDKESRKVRPGGARTKKPGAEGSGRAGYRKLDLASGRRKNANIRDSLPARPGQVNRFRGRSRISKKPFQLTIFPRLSSERLEGRSADAVTRGVGSIATRGARRAGARLLR